MKKILIFFLTALLAFGVGWAETATLTNANIVNAGTAYNSYQSWLIPDGNGKTWSAYAIKNYHSKATIDYHYLQIKKFGSSTAYYIQVPEFGTKITQIVMTVSGSSQTMNGGGNSATLYFSSSNSTSATGTGIASGTGGSSVTIDCSSLNLNTGYITASAAVRIWDITVTYESGSTPVEPIIYKKVTSSTELVADKQYIIVNEANGVGMGALTNNQYGSSISGLTFEGGKVDIAGKDVMEMTLGGESNAWTFNMGGTAPYLAVSGSTTDNTFLAAQSVQGRTNDITKWTITASSSSCIIQNNNVTTRSIRYSPSGNIFLTYTSSPNSYPYASLYVKYEGKVATPEFSLAAGSYAGTQNVSISCDTNGATIYYTIDGSTPTTSSTAYTGPIEMAHDMTIKAIAVAPAMDDSDVATATYTINLTPSLTATPNPLNINDDNTSGGRTGSFTVEGANLPSNVGVDVMSGNFSRTTTGGQNPDWGFVNNNGVNGTVNVTYDGNALSESGIIRLASGGVTTNVDVNYLYTGPIYLFGNVGVDADHINDFDFSNGVEMTRNTTDGTYSVNITAVGQNGGPDSWMFFSKSQGDETTAVSTKFGPDSNGPWYLQGQTDYTGQSISLDAVDTGSNAATIHLNPGEYTVQINPNDNTFTITPSVAAPVITPATGTYHEAQTVEITCATPGAAIYYTTDGTTPTASSTLYTAPFEVSSTTTVTAIAVSNSLTSDAATSTITIKLHGQGDFYLVTDAADLKAGDEIIFVNKNTVNASALAMSTTQNSNNRGTTPVEVVSTPDMSVADEYENMQIIFLEGDATNGWYFNVGDETDQYLYAASSSSNHLKTQSTKDNNAKATISISSDVATITFQGTNTHNVMQFNNSNGIVSCYESASQQDVYIYKRGTAQPRITVDPSTMELVIPAGGTSQSATATVTEHNTTGTTTVAITGEGASHFNATLENGTLTVTYNGTAAAATPDVATVTLTNGTATADVTVSGYRLPVTVTITPADGHNFQGSTVNGLIESNVDNATIEYSFDGTTWQTYDAEQGFTATVATVGGTVTVYARVTATNGQSAVAQATYTRVAKASTCTADIVFAPTTNNGEMSQWSTFVTHIGEGKDYISSTGSSVSKLWTSESYSAMRFGSGSYTGQLVLALDLSKFETGACKLAKVTINAARYGSDGDNCALKVSSSANSTGVTQNITATASQDQFGDYVFNFDGSEVTSITIENTSTSNGRVYVHSISIEYNCGASVESPAITPATGTYYEDQTVEITSAVPGATIYYTTDGTTPTPSSQQYNDPFVVEHQSGSTTTINAIAVINEDEEQSVSEPATVVYTWGTPSVVISPDSRNVTAESVTVTMTGTPANATIYYTTDGSTPTTASEQYNGAFNVSLPNVGDVANVKAIAVYNGQTSEVVIATYTRVDKVIDVKAPFFSPLAGTNGGYSGIYYGEQTLQIGCTTPNADIYYEIVEVTGETVPATVADPTKQSSYYDATQTITMEEGKSYRVKAIAYVGGFASTVSEGWYIVKSFSDFQNAHSGDGYTYVANCAEFNALTSTGSNVSFTNPVQVVYHSTYVNNGTMAEYCYVRDNTDYACIYFGKRDTHNYTIFKMGDWIDGYNISGEMNIWENNFHNQLGTSSHTIEYWPSEALGWSEIIPTTTTCNAISSGTTAPGHNLWGNYVHLRNTTMSDVADYASDDPKHKGTITDASGSDTYYDKFYLWSAGTCKYNSNYDVIHHLGDYDQAFFTTKQNAGATFDVYGIVDYYKPYAQPFEVCPIDFLWTYKPVITVSPGETISGQDDTYATAQTVTISATQPEWAAEDVVIYYKTDDMDDWAEYTDPFVVSSTTSVQTYAEVYAKKNDAAETDYNDYVRSVTVSQDFIFAGIEDPEIAPESRVIEIVNGNETVEVLIAANNDDNPNVITVYTTDGTMPSATNGTPIAAGDDIIELDPITETTTITAISYLPDANGNPVLWSNAVTETYTFVKKNGVIYDLLTTAPTVGNVYVIVNKDAYMGMSTKQNENNRGSVGVMFVDDQTKEKVYGNDELALFVLEKADGNRYYFKNINGDGYLTVAGNTGLQTGDADYYASAGVEIGSQADGYPATITFRGDKVRTMRYSANSRTFSTYTDAALNQDVFLYGVNATPLAYIESTPSLKGKQVTVSDELIGTWAVKNLLWAKDQGYANQKTFAEDGQQDYVKDILKYQRNEGWDQSNWVILDFTAEAGGAEKADEFVGRKIEMASVTGDYVDDVNYTIRLKQAPALAKDDSGNAIDVSDDYPGFTGPIDGVNNNPQAAPTGTYAYAYNTYVPANFLEENLNAPFGGGFVAGDAAATSHVGEQLFFVNPKVMEVARIWAVYAGTGEDGKDIFTVYEPDQHNVNGWGVEGAFSVEWDYNRLVASDPNALGRPQGIADKVNEAFLFHAVVASNTAIANAPLRAAAASQGTADATPSKSSSYRLYPLDFPNDGSNYTAVSEVRGVKTVESVRYYNIMGMESEKPFEGINIVVTRYSDGTTSTAKVLR